MQKLLTLLTILLFSTLVSAQYSSIGTFNAADDQVTPDSLRAYGNDQGVRSVWSGVDLDGDGLQEVLSTDYSNGGRVHVFELNGTSLELVFSTPASDNANNSTPRWVVTGDMDGDGNLEFIFNRDVLGLDGEIQVWEYAGSDNLYGDQNGTVPSLTMSASLFSPQGLLDFRTNRERATVYDFDGDGLDELIMANRDSKTYILGVSGGFPGFAAWQLEGGDPLVHPQNRFSGGSWWHSLPADMNGDGQMEIVNHYWNFYGFWSIKATGPDTYEYPDTTGGITNHYTEYMPDDGVAYMGVNVADVDGDNKDEIFGLSYVGTGSENNYNATLVSLPSSFDGIYGWENDGTQFAFLNDSLWQLAGKEAGSHWGTGAYDFNQNGKDELLLGGSADYNLITMEYNGTGSILDGANYDIEIVYGGDVNVFHNVDIYDSLGVPIDTVRYEGPFVSKMYAGCDVNGDGNMEVVMSYQSVADSITYKYYAWDQTAGDYLLDSTWKVFNPNAVNLRVIEYTGASGFQELDLDVVTPDDYVLEQNYPNPFNPSTTIRFSLPVDKKISLKVYDILGNEVKTLLGSEELAKGAYEVTWDGTNNFGSRVASGTYIYTLKYGNFSKSMKMTLLK
jgi:hypothetical protein